MLFFAAMMVSVIPVNGGVLADSALLEGATNVELKVVCTTSGCCRVS